jgi:hypothetical protein
MESTVTASRSTPPVTTNLVPDERPRRPSPLSIEPITSAPSSALLMWPRPPNRLVPPITAAAIEYSRIEPPPALVSTERRREARMMPPTAAISEQIAKHMIFTRSLEMPARRLASALPPSA